jgi:glycosyltransferase involved in cell wall biosynthesis
LNILQITHNYPSETERTEGIFIHRINCELAERIGITVLVLRPKFRIPTKTKIFTIDGIVIIEVDYFRPRGRIFNSLDGVFMLSAKKTFQLQIKKFDVIHSHWQTDGGLLGIYFSKKYRKPHLVSVRGARIFDKSRKSIYGAISSFVFKNSNLIHTNGRSIQIELGKRYQISDQKLRWIPNIIFNEIQLNRLLKMSLSKSTNKDNYTFLFIGLDGKNKGLLDAVRSFLQSNTESHHLIILTDTSRNFYQKTIKPLVSDKTNITILNKMPPESVFELFAKSDVFLYPSYAEGSPNVVIEAMAAGCYIICYKIPGLDKLITHNENGRLVKNKDVSSLSREINLFVAGKMKHYFDKYREYNYSFIVENYNSDKIAHDYFKMYERCIQ